MQVRQTVLTALDAAALAPLAEISPNLVLVFAAPAFFSDATFAAELARAFPQARRLALSTAGEISGQGVSENSIVVTAIRFEHVPFKVASTDFAGMDDSAAAGRRLAEQLLSSRSPGRPKNDLAPTGGGSGVFSEPGAQPTPDLKAVLLLSQGVAVNGSELIGGAVSVLGKDIPLTGGLAGDNGAFTRTWAMLDEVVSDRLMLAVGFYGDAVSFAHGSFGGWQSFGPARRATRAAGNVLYELDGEPALAIYKRYLGEYAKDLPASGLLFPFAILSHEREETGLIRTLLGINEADGSLTLAGDIPQDGYLKLMHASTEALVEGAEAAAQAARLMARADGQSLALLISCIGRKLVMGDRVDEEVEAVGAVFGQGCALTGFYSNGEISPFLETTECKLHNQTMTITWLGEAG